MGTLLLMAAQEQLTSTIQVNTLECGYNVPWEPQYATSVISDHDHYKADTHQPANGILVFFTRCQNISINCSNMNYDVFYIYFHINESSDD